MSYYYFSCVGMLHEIVFIYLSQFFLFPLTKVCFHTYCYVPKGLGDEGKQHISFYSGIKRREKKCE